MNILRSVSMLLAVSAIVLAPKIALGDTERSESTGPNLRPSATATSGNFGIGVMLGDPSGATAKIWTSRQSAVQLGLAYDFDNFMVLSGDYLWHFDLRSAPELHPYIGAGAELFVSGTATPMLRGYNNAVEFAARIPVGAEWMPHNAPLGVFAELVPAVALVPSTFALFQGDVGIRFYL